MATTIDLSDGSTTVRLEGEVGISGAQELKGSLMEALASRCEVRIDLSEATGLDITAIQLIWAAERAAKDAGLVFSIGPLPETIALSIVDAGLEPFSGTLQ